jgi:hypothetical protein
VHFRLSLNDLRKCQRIHVDLRAHVALGRHRASLSSTMPMHSNIPMRLLNGLSVTPPLDYEQPSVGCVRNVSKRQRLAEDHPPRISCQDDLSTEPILSAQHPYVLSLRLRTQRPIPRRNVLTYATAKSASLREIGNFSYEIAEPWISSS